MRAERASVIHATFASKNLEGSLQFELDNAIHVISKESLVGASKFVKEGLGWQGKFNVNPVEKEGREIEHEAMKVQANEADKEKMSQLAIKAGNYINLLSLHTIRKCQKMARKNTFEILLLNDANMIGEH